MPDKRPSPEIEPSHPAEINDPQYWEDHAAAARSKAELITNAEAQELMLGVALQYERLARWARKHDLSLS